MAFVESRYFGPLFTPPNPRQIVFHSVECDLIEGIGESLAEGYFREESNQTSAHSIVDPAGQTDMVKEVYRAWHCGNGNTTSLGDEQAGRASFTREQWTTEAGMRMLRLQAKKAAQQCRDHNIRPRWLSLTQLANNEDGFCTHNDMRKVRGGTTHTDPGPNYPYDLVLQMVNEELGNVPREPDPAEAPNPTTEEEEMPTPQEYAKAVVAELKLLEFTASDAVDAEAAQRAGKPYSPGKLRLVPYLEWLGNRGSMGARDAYALRNFKDASSNIVAAVKDLLLARGAGTVRDTWLNWIWDVKISAERPREISFGEAIRRTWKKVTGDGSTPAPSNDPNTGDDAE